MSTSNFEFTFEVAELNDTAVDAIELHYDCVESTHGRTTELTLLVPGMNATDAASEAINRILAAGVTVRRLVDDLVTRTEIAERADVTSQAVGLWARGERKRGVSFPEPYVYAGSVRLWLWGEVATYLRAAHVPIDEGVQYPGRAETLRIAGLIADLLAGHRPVTAAG
ncbi:hypothetical protein [Ruania zhangjianzhongii]|uniref:hypothetical protein n=1 Tax=Ruania zhangjianzhongii TaxID=2603206 RepID=UPI0011C770B3|nr:hypothetical protein [Ruania zhangjianzhongii]